MDDIHTIRKKIDTIDDQIIDLLIKRLNLVQKLKPQKKHLTDKLRENKILSKLSSKYLEEIYQTIFEVSKKKLQED